MLTALIAASFPVVFAQNLNFKIPAVKIPLTIKDQTVNIVASGQLTQLSKGHDDNLFNLELRADLSDLQQNMTALLSSALDKDAQCGDRIAIQSATLMPAAPAAIATVQMHYERWICAKIFGKQQVKKLVGGNATIPLTLTPSIDETNTELRLRDKMQAAIQNAMQKAANLTATLPPVAQPYATIQSATFQDTGGGNMALVLDGRVHITKEQVQQLSKQLKDRVGK